MINTTSPFIFVDHGQLWTTSHAVAAYFGKSHGHLLRDIRRVALHPATPVGCFVKTVTVVDQNRQEYPAYNISRDGFLLMGFRGYETLRRKVEYMREFDHMERSLVPAARSQVAVSRPSTAIMEAVQKPSVKLTGAYLQGVRGLMQDFFKVCPDLAPGIRHAVAARFVQEAGIDLPVASPAPSPLYNASQLARELGITVAKLSRNARYKALKTAKHGVDTFTVDSQGNPRSTWNWNAEGRKAVLEEMRTEKEKQFDIGGFFDELILDEDR